MLALVIQHNRGYDYPAMLEIEIVERLNQARIARMRRVELFLGVFFGVPIGTGLLFIIFKLAGGH